MTNPWERDWSASPDAASANPWERDWSGAAPSRSNDTPTRLEAFGYNAADSASLGFGDEAAGAIAGVGAVLGGGDYQLAYRARVDAARQRLEAARAAHPVSSLAGSFAGATATFLIPGVGEAAAARAGLTGLQGASAAARGLMTGERLVPYGRALLQAAGEGGTALRSARALGAQAALGAGQGAIYGGVYGLGAADDGDRVEGARNGALMGGAFGAVGPAAFQGLGRAGRFVFQSPALRTVAGSAAGGAIGYSQGDTEQERQQNALRGAAFGAGLGALSRPALNAARNAWRNPGAYANQTSMGIVPPPASGAARPNEPEIPEGVVRQVDRLLGRQRMGVSELEGRITAAQQEPLGRTLADVGGEQFLSKTDALAQLPGQTGPRASALAEQRARDLPDQLTSELQTRLGVSNSPTEALQSLQNEYRDVSKNLYQPLLQQDVSPQGMARLQPIIDRLPAAVRNRANRITEELAVMDGLTPAQITGAQRVHYMKMALDDAIMGVQQAEGLGAAQRAGLRRLKNEFLDVIEGDPDRGVEPLIPGYREARMQWGGIKDAEDAMQAGREAVGQRPQEVRAVMAQMTPFEKQHYRIAAADELIRRVQRGSAAVGQRNAANPLNNNEIQNVVREIFDNPDEAEAFIRILNERNVLLRNASAWIGNSATARRAAQAGDSLLSAMAPHALNPVGAATEAGKGAFNALRTMAFERENNALGQALLRNVEGSSAEDTQATRALLAALRRLERERLDRARSAGREGAQGAIGGGSYSDQSQGYY